MSEIRDEEQKPLPTIESLLFVGLNGRVAALDRESGAEVWSRKLGSGYVILLVDGDRLIASVNGYLYCLDPLTGEQLWYNPLKGWRTGVAALATVYSSTSHALMIQAAADAAARAAAAAAAGS